MKHGWQPQSPVSRSLLKALPKTLGFDWSPCGTLLQWPAKEQSSLRLPRHGFQLLRNTQNLISPTDFLGSGKSLLGRGDCVCTDLGLRSLSWDNRHARTNYAGVFHSVVVGGSIHLSGMLALLQTGGPLPWPKRVRLSPLAAGVLQAP